MEEEQVELFIPEPTKEKSGNIKAIGKDTVHKICSGQVVLSLAVAVKELVENAIDAGATLVEVKLRDHGLESMEVSDNGSGVAEKNLEAMTAKYHTSKIREFVDLQGVETFGFRGEALSSLCSLADMTILTRHQNSNVGIKVELDHEGIIKKRSPCARSFGTTVTLANLFTTLPVRRRDFTRNIKKEFARMCQILQAYCLVSKGVRIICTNQTPKGAKTVVMQTHGAQDVLANITAIFGSKQTADIIPLKSPFAEGELTAESLRADLQSSTNSVDNTQITAEDVERLNAEQFRLEGFVSSCSHGAGRASKDRQYFYINSRPCDPKNIAKVMNEVYHRYNVQQVPFIFLNVFTARADVDINLTPDKRQLLINNEKLLLLAIKKALINTYGNIPATYKMQNSTILSMFKSEENNAESNANDENGEDVPISSSQRFMDVLSQWKNTGDTKGIAPHLTAPKRKTTDEIAIRTLKMKKINEFLKQESRNTKESDTIHSYKALSDSEGEELGGSSGELSSKINHNASVLDINKLQAESAEYDALTQPTIVKRIDCKTITIAQPRLSFVHIKSENNTNNSSKFPLKTSQDTTDSENECNISTTFLSQSSFTKTVELDNSSDNEGDENTLCKYSSAEIRTSLAEIELSMQAEENLSKERRAKSKLERLRFKIEINPNQNQNAEAELQREISKTSFALMEIIGQFNLGFIIVKLDSDLFIVDQHATDEKYNFEMLQRTTVLQNQKLAVPQQLEMTAINEMILLDNLAVFEKNGFKFEINENAPATKKVRLLAKPFSKNWEFGKEDIDELIFMLQDAPEGSACNCRPSRIHAMFASRACRKSVMIGNALNRGTMKKLIRHMGEIEQPWNCPHGRPTMRHLINVEMLLDAEDDGPDDDNDNKSANNTQQTNEKQATTTNT